MVIPALPGYQHIWVSMNPATRHITTRRTPVIAWTANNGDLEPISLFNYEGLPVISEFERYAIQDPQGNVTTMGAYFPLGRDFSRAVESSLLKYASQFD